METDSLLPSTVAVQPRLGQPQGWESGPAASSPAQWPWFSGRLYLQHSCLPPPLSQQQWQQNEASQQVKHLSPTARLEPYYAGQAAMAQGHGQW